MICHFSWTSWIVVTAKPGSAFPPPSGALQPTTILETSGCSSKSLGLDVSLRMKNPAKLEGDALDGLAASKHGYQVIGHINALSALKQKIVKGKLLFSKWRLTCSFPGLQLRVLRVLWVYLLRIFLRMP
ncbi:NBPF family member NBPF6-like [Equus przewalskii]|uniref:NBPF family member NBPF6-like n=1 Tax=Equus przewalskii TaxID=9798 RepID=A0ABM4M428_EQUPR